MAKTSVRDRSDEDLIGSGSGRQLRKDDNEAKFNTESVAADQLKSFIDKIERLEEEKAGISGDIKEVFAEAKGNGFDTKIIRRVLAIRKRDFAERQEEETVLELYMQALGMI